MRKVSRANNVPNKRLCSKTTQYANANVNAYQTKNRIGQRQLKLPNFETTLPYFPLLPPLKRLLSRYEKGQTKTKGSAKLCPYAIIRRTPSAIYKSICKREAMTAPPKTPPTASLDPELGV